MDRGVASIDPSLATALVQRWLEPTLTVTGVRKLHGGMIHRVGEWITDGEPASLVAKINVPEHIELFRQEMAILQWYRKHTRFPVPEPYACIEPSEAFAFSGLLMEKVAGPTLADARLSLRGVRQIQHDLAAHVAELHSHHRDSYGSALEPKGHARWIDAFGPTLEQEFATVREQLSSRSRWVVDDLIRRLDAWLPEEATPTLVHGDLWGTNVLVDDAHPDRPTILAFIDCGATFCDPEYELAYLRLFQTAGEDFFSLYSQRHPLRPGFERRCRVYWLNTMLMHVRAFGERYVPACEDLAGQIRRLG